MQFFDKQYQKKFGIKRGEIKGIFSSKDEKSYFVTVFFLMVY